jgi:hypothetical protein
MDQLGSVLRREIKDVFLKNASQRRRRCFFYLKSIAGTKETAARIWAFPLSPQGLAYTHISQNLPPSPVERALPANVSIGHIELQNR